MRLELYFDGSCKNIKGQFSKMGVGLSVLENGEEVYSCGYSPEEYGTSNIAEWYGLISALYYLTTIDTSKYSEIIIHSDSQLIVNLFLGKYKMTATHFLIYYNEAKSLSKNISFELIWVPREQNKRADELSVIGRKS